MITASLNWELFQHELKGFVYKRVKDKSVTEDIVHDVFLKVQSKMEQLRDREKTTGWIYQITRNAIADHFRKKAKENINPKDLDWENNPGNFNDCVSRCLNELLPTLPDKYRIPLEMTELENISQIEVAARLGLTYTAAKARIQRARRMLKDRIDEVLIVKTDCYGNVILCRDRTPCC